MTPRSLTVVNYVFDKTLASPALLLERYDSLTNWCEAVARTGLQVRVVQAFSCDAEVSAGGVDYVFRRSEGPRTHRVARVRDAVVAQASDVVHVNGLETVSQTWRLRHAVPDATALVVQDHGGAAPRSHLSRFVKRALMRDIDGYLFTSKTHAEKWVTAGLIRSDAVHEVLEASTAFRPVPRAEARAHTATTGTPAVLWVGRLQPNKDPLTIIRGFFACAERLPASTLTMIFHEADLLEAVQREVDGQPRYAGRVRLVGEVAHHDMPAWYSAADVFVLGSASEVCGYSALEACACGVTPVVSDIAAFRAITGHGAIGRLWHRGDPRAFTDALVDVCADLATARARVIEYFAANLSWDAVAKSACVAYARACERRALAPRRR